MEIRAYKPHFIIIGLMILTSLALAYTVNVEMASESGIRMYMPDSAGPWSGVEMRFCHNPECQAEYTTAELGGEEKCKVCRAELHTMSYVEANALPPDTEILKKQYWNNSGAAVFASVVLSATERDSIHRPQLCLVGQGWNIVGNEIIAVDLDARDPLRVMVLEILRPARTESGEVKRVPAYYAYWFVGRDRETPYHLQRMIWMATDRILFNVAHRWAYIAVSGDRDEQGRYLDEIQSFVRDIYPHMVKPMDSA